MEMNSTWKKIWPRCVHDGDFMGSEPSFDDPTRMMQSVVDLENDVGLEVSGDDVV